MRLWQSIPSSGKRWNRYVWVDAGEIVKRIQFAHESPFASQEHQVDGMFVASGECLGEGVSLVGERVQVFF